jgi:hypothetical protein
MVFVAVAGAWAGVVSPAAPRKAVAARIAACYERPEKNLPVRYIDKNAAIEVDSLYVDSLEAAWFRLRGAAGWVLASEVRLADEGRGDSVSLSMGTDADRKRRLAVLRDHPDWPRRIIRAVRSGTVCLEMTSEQLVASWGEPFQKSAGFVLGAGPHDVWLFRGNKEEVLVVHLLDGRVIGWSK